MPGKAATEGVVIIATLEIQEAPSGTRTGLTSFQGALAILLVASQLLAFVQLPEAHGGSEPAPAAGAGPAVAAAPGRKRTSSGGSSSSRTEAAEAAEAAVVATVGATVVATGVAVRGPEAVLG